MIVDLGILGTNEALIPFIFVLAIIFGVLEISKVIRNRGAMFLISLALAFFTITSTNFVSIFPIYAAILTPLFIIIFFITFIMQIFGLRRPRLPNEPSREPEALIIIGAILFLLLSLGFIYSNFIPALPFIGGGSNVIILAAVIFILVIFWVAFKAGREELGTQHTPQQPKR